MLKADVSEAGEGWSDSAILAALDTSINNIGRTRRRLVEEGMAAALTRRIQSELCPAADFDGAAEAKLIALTCSPAPEGFARWSLRLLEEKVVELNIIKKASDNTIGRILKKTSSSPTAIGNGSFRTPTPASLPPWKTCWKFTKEATPIRSPPCVSMDESSKQLIVRTRRLRFQPDPDEPSGTIWRNTSETA